MQDETAQTSPDAGQPAGDSTNGSTASDEQTEDEALDKLFGDPAVQEMLYQHLPESMRNKETFEWMLNNPEYRKQLQDVLKKQVSTEACTSLCDFIQKECYFLRVLCKVCKAFVHRSDIYIRSTAKVILSAYLRVAAL